MVTLDMASRQARSIAKTTTIIVLEDKESLGEHIAQASHFKEYYFSSEEYLLFYFNIYKD